MISVRRRLLCGLALTFVWLSTQPEPSATAQQACNILARIETVLNKYGENLIAVGVTGDHQMRFYANPHSQKWTVISVDVRGVACVLASGEDFDLVPLPPRGPKT